MNWMILDAIAIAVLILFFAIGRHRGLVAMALLLLGTLAALWTAHHFAQPAAQWAYDNYANQWLVDYVDQRLEEADISGDTAALGIVLEEFSDQIGLMSDFDFLKGKAQELLEEFKNFAAMQDGLGIASAQASPQTTESQQQAVVLQLLADGHTLSQALVQTILQPLALTLLEMLAFLLIFLGVNLLLKLLIRASNIINKLPLLGGLNRFLGGLCGLAEGLVCLYIVGIVLRMVAATASSNTFLTIELLKETKILSSIIFFLQ